MLQFPPLSDGVSWKNTLRFYTIVRFESHTWETSSELLFVVVLDDGWITKLLQSTPWMRASCTSWWDFRHGLPGPLFTELTEPEPGQHILPIYSLRRRFFPCSLPPKHIQITTAPPRQTSKSNTKCTVFNRIRQALDEQQKALDSLAKGEYIDAAWGNLDDVSELIMSRNALYRGENLSWPNSGDYWITNGFIHLEFDFEIKDRVDLPASNPFSSRICAFLTIIDTLGSCF
jgi:hypothetical protein